LVNDTPREREVLGGMRKGGVGNLRARPSGEWAAAAVAVMVSVELVMEKEKVRKREEEGGRGTMMR
jgi:hypothetical protein